MIASLNSDCSILTLNSTSLAEAAGKVFDSLVLKSRLNCSLTESSVDISSLIDEITDSEIQIPATLFYNDATKTHFCDGVYYFQLDTTYTVDDEESFLAQDSACVLIDCDLKCKVLELYTAKGVKDIWYKYYALKIGGDCDSCYCTNMCALYADIKLMLNDYNISYSADGCGCS